MTTRLRLLTVAVVMTAASAAMGDGMIVPVRPDIRVRGSWTVKYHHVDVKVRDQVAMVSIDQAFENTGSGMIEVEYLFPVPPGAAIDSMTLMVNGKEFAAKLYQADEARKIYESIVRKKKDPALLEYVGFGLYRTRAFPLEPGKPVKVLVTYKNICKKDRDLVEVWYPLNTEKFSAKKIQSVRVTVDVKSKADVTTVYSPTHDVKVDRKDSRHIVATYEAKDVLPAIDFQVFYKSANEAVGVTLLTHQPEAGKDGYFLLLVSPNPRNADSKVVPKDIVVALDRSGSMNGAKIKQAKGAVNHILNSLNKDDRFNIVAYSDSVEPFFADEMAAANEENTRKAADILDRLEASGGTNIDEALQVSLKILGGKSSGRPKYIIFVTDGLPTVGKTNEAEIVKGATKANTCNARIFAFGVGYDVNVRLLDKLVDENNGRSDYCKPKEPIEAKISSLYNKIKNPVMTELKVVLQKVTLRDPYPRKLGDLFEGDQIVMVGRYDTAAAKKLATAEGAYQGQLVVTGKYLGKERGFEYPVTVCKAGKDIRYTFIEKLWAIRRVGYLLDQIQLHGKSQEVVDELVRLSMKYGIITPYTSFLADETVRLHAPMRPHAMKSADRLAGEVNGASAQVAAKARQSLKYARQAPAAQPEAPVANGAGKAGPGGSVVYGNTSVRAYEADKVERATTVRNVANQGLYRRGRVWVAANAAQVDMAKDADKIQRMKQYSKEYFELTRQNTAEENQILASQQEGEELLITLRGQTYLFH